MSANYQFKIYDMDPEMRLQMEVAEMILKVADERQDLTQSDFQSRVDVIARKIIALMRNAEQSH